jgi:hypothetical protein
VPRTLPPWGKGAVAHLHAKRNDPKRTRLQQRFESARCMPPGSIG